MTKIYLIRHAEAEGNLYRIVQGRNNSYITANGYKQIDALAERFRDVHLDALYSSDRRRTMTTAGAILRYHDLKLITTPQLQEINMGICEGMSFGNMRKMDPVQMDNFNNDPDKWHCEGAETFAEVAQRMIKAVSGIAEKHDGQIVAIVSHGMAIRSMLSDILDVKSRDIAAIPHGDNTAVTCLYYENGKFTVEYYNDNSHVPPELSTFAKQSWWKAEAKGRDEANLSYFPIDPYKDGETYIKYYSECWMAVHGSLEGFSPEPYLASAKENHDINPDSLVGIYAGDEMIGMLELNTKRGEHAGYGWISLIYLDEKHRGRQLGIQPLGYAIVRYQGLGRDRVRLHVSANNEKAIEFYKYWGFEKIGEEPGINAPLYLMEKRFV